MAGLEQLLGDAEKLRNFTRVLGFCASFSSLFQEIRPQMPLANLKKLALVCHPPDFVEELAGPVGAGRNEIHGLLHFLHLRILRDIGRANRLVKAPDVIQNLGSRRLGNGPATAQVAVLVEKPGIRDGTASDHEAAGTGSTQCLDRPVRRIDIPIGQHRTWEGFDGPGDQIVPNLPAIHIRNGATVDGEQVERVPGKNGQEPVEYRRVIKSDPGFHGKPDGYGLTERAKDGVDAIRIAQETAPGAFAVNHGGRASEVEVDGSDGELLQFARGPDQRRDVVANHLGDGRSAGGIAGEGLDDPFLEVRVFVDAEILGVIKIRAAVLRHEPPKGEVGYVLHWGKGQDGFVPGQQRVELGTWTGDGAGRGVGGRWRNEHWRFRLEDRITDQRMGEEPRMDTDGYGFYGVSGYDEFRFGN